MGVWSLGQEIPWRRAWQPTPVFLPGESHGESWQEPGWLQSIGSQRVRHDWSNLACTHFKLEHIGTGSLKGLYFHKIEYGTVTVSRVKARTLVPGVVWLTRTAGREWSECSYDTLAIYVISLNLHNILWGQYHYNCIPKKIKNKKSGLEKLSILPRSDME